MVGRALLAVLLKTKYVSRDGEGEDDVECQDVRMVGLLGVFPRVSLAESTPRKAALKRREAFVQSVEKRLERGVVDSVWPSI